MSWTFLCPNAIKLGLFVVIAATLSACVSQQTQQTPSLLRQSHGYVIAEIPRVIGTNPPAIMLRAISTGSEFELVPTQPSSQTLALWVPQGTYEISGMVGNDKGTYTPIQVQAGKVTDLGGLTWASVGDRKRVLLPLRHREIKANIDKATNRIDELVSSERIEWKPSAPPKPQPIPTESTNLGLVADLLVAYAEEMNSPPLREQLREAKSIEAFTKIFVSSAPPLLGDPSYNDDGSIYIGSNFGQLRKRDSQGTWRSSDTGTISAITAVEASARRIIVGTYDGLLLTSTDNEETWNRLHKFDDGEMVLSIHLIGNQYFVLTGRSKSPSVGALTAIDSLQVYTLNLPNQAQPKLVRKIELPSKLSFFGLPSVKGIHAGKYYLVNALTSVERFDLDSLSWKKLSLPHDATRLHPASNGSVITAFKAQGAFSKLSISTDFGETWSSIETPPYPVNDIRMESPASGFASRWDMGLFASALQWMQYDSATKSWKQTWAAPPSACVRTIRDVSGKERFCVSGGGSVLRVGSGKLEPEFLAD